MPKKNNTTELKLKRGRPSLEQEAEVTEAIIQVATAQFLTLGYEATSIEAVAREAGIYKNAIYKRFANKQLLFKEVLERKIAQWSVLAESQEDDAGVTLEQRLKSHLRRTIHWSSHPEVAAFRRLRQTLDPEIDSFSAVAKRAGQQSMVDRMAADIRRLTADDPTPAQYPERVADALLSMVAGWLDVEMQGKRITKKAAASFADWAVNLVINGRQEW